MENKHTKSQSNIPPIITESNDSNDQTIARQLLMQLHDKGLVSTRTLLASFFIDIDIERKNFSEEESYNVHK